MTETNATRAAGSSAPACSTCRFFEPESETCRRRPPVVVGGSWGFGSAAFGFLMRSSGTEWPDVSLDDWCGEHDTSNATNLPRSEAE